MKSLQFHWSTAHIITVFRPCGGWPPRLVHRLSFAPIRRALAG
jgi:hypothetical protein